MVKPPNYCLTWLKLNSTGVILPKILTITVSFSFSSSILSTTPTKPSNGPSLIVTSPPTTRSLFLAATVTSPFT